MDDRERARVWLNLGAARGAALMKESNQDQTNQRPPVPAVVVTNKGLPWTGVAMIGI